jgi:amino acid transporter
MAVLAVMLSSIGTLETSILQFTRTLFSLGRGGALHPRFSKLHPRWRTPWIATLTITILGLVLLLLASTLPDVNTILKDSVHAIGFQVAFYYSLTISFYSLLEEVLVSIRWRDLRPGMKHADR